MLSPVQRRLWLLLPAAIIGGAVFLLRWPSFGFAVWNVDEAIHAAIGRVLLHGGVLYHDTIDLRAPLSYYAVAAIFGLCGENNIGAVQAFATLLIAATAFLLYLIGRTIRRPGTGIWAAVLFPCFATGLFYEGDAFASNTEWYVAFFTTAAAATFWPGLAPARGLRLFFAGALSSLAFLSKQPALLDFAAPALTLAYIAWREPAERRSLIGQLLLLVGGFLTPLLLTVGYFALEGALDDFIFYSWTFNFVYYVPEITTADRLASFVVPVRLLSAFSPLLFIAGIGAGAALLFRVMQRSASEEERPGNPSLVYLGIWCATSLAGAATGGRGFDHYFIQALPAFSLLAGAALAWAGRVVLTSGRNWFLRVALAVILAAAIVPVLQKSWSARSRTLSPDASLRAAQFIQAHTRPDERVFVWGFQPEVYLFSNRLPASRYVFGTYLTGLIPWSNTAPDIDTSYAVVPGAMENLLRDLEKHRPAFIVDCSAGPNRFWNKYPLEHFPRLHDHLARHYVVIEPGQFLPQGFRLFYIKDDYRRKPVSLVGGPGGRNPTAQILGAHDFEPKPDGLLLGAADPEGRLQKIELLVDGQSFESIAFPPSKGLSVRFTVPFDRLPGRHQLVARATTASGGTVDSAPHDITTNAARLSPEQLAQFAVPQITANLSPLFVSAPFGATVVREGDRVEYFAHAPSTIAYAVPAGARKVTGRIGFRPGAYAAGNSSATDGAEFVIDLVRPDGARFNLFRRLLRPRENETERDPQSFSAAIPADARGQLEFIIGPGPHDSSASDWTFWSNLAFETSR